MTSRTDFLDQIEARGLVHAVTPGAREALGSGPVTGYNGFDPTAPSLHVGHLLPLLGLVRFQRAGHRPVLVVGGGTGLIGDPGGRDSERPLLDEDTVAGNVAALERQVRRFLDFDGTGGAVLVDNRDWLGGLSLISFLRDVGKHFSVNAMIQRDSVRNRLEAREQGISYTEFSYMLLQAYDYLEIHRRYGCRIQMGGSDQWGNILSGVDLVRRLCGVEVQGLTYPLLLRPDGKKFGKSEGGSVWLDAELTSPYAFYQSWINADDDGAVKYLKFFTFLPLDRIEEIAREHERARERRLAQRVLAAEVTDLVHGVAARERAERTTAVLFEGGEWGSLTASELREAFAASPASDLPRHALGTAAASLVAVLADVAGICPSRGRAREDIRSGAISRNDQRITDERYVLTEVDLLGGSFVVLRKGRKTYHVVRIVDRA